MKITKRKYYCILFERNQQTIDYVVAIAGNLVFPVHKKISTFFYWYRQQSYYSFNEKCRKISYGCLILQNHRYGFFLEYKKEFMSNQSAAYNLQLESLHLAWVTSNNLLEWCWFEQISPWVIDWSDQGDAEYHGGVAS